MAYVLMKRSKYLTGHNYASVIGYKFFWSADQAEARRFDDDDAYTDFFADATHSKIVHVPNTRKEAKAFAKRAMQCRHQSQDKP